MNQTVLEWKRQLDRILREGSEVSPRGMKVKEIINGGYAVPMPAYLDLKDRKVNLSFMMAEAGWIIAGSNRLFDIEYFMKSYGNFSDDGVFMKGAYGPKIIDQLPYVTDTLVNDPDTRQAVLTIWRERPGPSKDIPCTVAMQFFIRDEKLHAVVTMRSQDIVLGFTYDVFTFSMVAKAVKNVLIDRKVYVELGTLYVNAGSLHLYERHFDDAKQWLEADDVDLKIGEAVERLRGNTSYPGLINQLVEEANNAKENL